MVDMSKNGYIQFFGLQMLEAVVQRCSVKKVFWEILQNSQENILYNKWSFLLGISSVNVTKSAVSCGFGYIYWRNP